MNKCLSILCIVSCFFSLYIKNREKYNANIATLFRLDHYSTRGHGANKKETVKKKEKKEEDPHYTPSMIDGRFLMNCETL